jgi:hypothetical protein
MSTLNGHRNRLGQFTVGNPGGPGRPRRAVEQDYLATLADAVPLRKWKKIIMRAVDDALEGDPRARRWLGRHLLGDEPISLAELAATELAGTLDQDIQARADGLRGSAYRRSILNRAQVPSVPRSPAPTTDNGAAKSLESPPPG